MNSNTLRLLGFVVAILVVTLVVIQTGEDGAPPASGNPLLPELRSVVNDVDRLTITRAGEEPVVLNREAGEWRVAARADYPADMTDVRAVLLAMIEATVVEEKTANPELHGQLGLEAPDVEDSKGILVSAAAGERAFDLIFGNSVRGSYRYARIAGENQSWLIDQNPTIPAEIGEWLRPNIIDIDAAGISSVTITHPDGEAISISKGAAEDTDFEVADIPEGRELSYSTVANGLAGALNNLLLDDVRAAQPESEPVVTRFETFGGMTVTVRTTQTGEEYWISLTAENAGEAGDLAAEINARVGGWQYRVADYKASLLTRRWKDILKAEEPAE